MNSDETRSQREQELIEAGRQAELIAVVREAVRSEMRAGFRLHYGDSTPEEVRKQHTRVSLYLQRWDTWMDRFWFGFARAIGWVFFIAIVGNWAIGNPFFEGLLKRLGDQ